jgi:glycosyltransferase involved in cell wall biosynthesis
VKLSIAMATYNGAPYLQEQLDSFVTQTLLPDELVVCDDLSSDNTWDLLKKFQQSAPFSVRLYQNQKNLGYAKNFGRALSLAEADIIFLSDQDDVWLPAKLETVVTLFNSNPDILIVTNDQELTNAQLITTGLSTFGQHKAAGHSRTAFTVGCCTAIRESVRYVILPIPAHLDSHDLWLHYIAESMRIRKIIPEILQYHRRHDHNSSDSKHNPTSRTSLLQQARSSWSNDPYSYWEHRKMHLEAVASRLKSVTTKQLPDFSRVNFTDAIKAITKEQNAMMDRQSVVKSSGLTRIRRAITMMARGEYRYFLGWKSFLKDLLR